MIRFHDATPSAWPTRVLALAALVAGLAAVTLALLGATSAPLRAGAASAMAGAFTALTAAAGTAAALDRARARGPQAGWRTSVLAVVAKMAFIGLALGATARFAWFRPLPWVLTFGVLYFATGIWLAVQTARAARLRSAAADRGEV